MTVTALHMPDWRGANPYQSLLASALEDLGVVVHWADFVDRPFRLTSSWLRSGRADVVHLHWITDLIGPAVWRSRRIGRALGILELIVDVFMLRLLGVRVVWTIHNKVAHESLNPEAEVVARRWLGRVVSRVIVHSATALSTVESAYGLKLKGKTSVIPHGNYDGCYLEGGGHTQRLREELALSGSETVVLFFGAVREYKGVFRLLDAFKATARTDLCLVVAGSTMPEELGPRIVASAGSDTRIRLRLGFIPDDDVAAYFELSDAAVIPMERSLTSGSTVLSMTFARAPILSEEGRNFDLVDDDSALFFSGTDELRDVLESLDKGTLRTLGRRARQQSDKLDWRAIGKATRSVYTP